MTAFEKFLLALLVLYAASHMAVKFGKAAGVPTGVVSISESLITA